MKKTLFFLVLVIVCGNIGAQDAKRYSALCDSAYQLYENKKHLESALVYNMAFAALGHKGYPNDRYNAACSWALAGREDSAFTQLFKIAERVKYSNLNHLTTDTDLKSLYHDERWAVLVAKVRANKEEAEKDLDKTLVRILDSVEVRDQRYRMQMHEAEKKYGWGSKEMKALWKVTNYYDSINLIEVTKILDERGWLGPEVVGEQGSSALFLVIQHSDQATREKYLPMMREAVKNKKANASSLALLEDRVLLGQKKHQLYGSQIASDSTGKHFVQPLFDPDNVDTRRAEMGLGTLATYVAYWNIRWDVEAYKKELPGLEKQFGIGK